MKKDNTVQPDLLAPERVATPAGALERRAPANVTRPVDGDGTMAALIQLAIDKNVPVEALEKLVMLNERIADRNAAQEFNEAMARFQRACPVINKGVTAQIATKSGAKFSYKYAPLDAIVAGIREPLHKEGLSYSWDSEVNKERGMLKVVCTVSHINGHSRPASFELPWETEAGMSSQQKFAAALSFGQRKSLEQALGITSGEDADGADLADRLDKISESEAADLESMIVEVKANRPALLKFAGVTKIEDIPKSRHAEIVGMLEKKRRS